MRFLLRAFPLFFGFPIFLFMTYLRYNGVCYGGTQLLLGVSQTQFSSVVHMQGLFALFLVLCTLWATTREPILSSGFDEEDTLFEQVSLYSSLRM